MRPSDIFEHIGRPIAYFPELAKRVGSVKAGILLSQIIYWANNVKKDHDAWIYKSMAELHDETGLSREELMSARKILVNLKLVEEDYQRIGHRMYYRLNKDALDALLESPPPEKPSKVSNLPKSEKPTSGNRETQFGEVGKPNLGKSGKPTSRSGKNQLRGVGNPDLELKEHRLQHRLPETTSKNSLSEPGFSDTATAASERDDLKTQKNPPVSENNPPVKKGKFSSACRELVETLKSVLIERTGSNAGFTDKWFYTSCSVAQELLDSGVTKEQLEATIDWAVKKWELKLTVTHFSHISSALHLYLARNSKPATVAKMQSREEKRWEILCQASMLVYFDSDHPYNGQEFSPDELELVVKPNMCAEVFIKDTPHNLNIDKLFDTRKVSA